MSKKLLFVACCLVALTFALTLAACGSSGSTKTSTNAAQNVAGTKTETSGGSGESTAARTSIDACLAAHGIKAPTSGNGTIKLPAGVTPEKFDAILKGCAHKAGVGGGVKGKAAPPTAHDHKVAFERLLLCLKNHGAGLKNGGNIDKQKLAEAEHACRNVLKDTIALERVTHPSIQDVHVGAIHIGKVKIGKINLGKIKIGKVKVGKVKIKRLEQLGSAKAQEANGEKG